ncbi:probable E3 ubiquitin-protein ligase rbrA isoform X1 [Amborella trichopoda]|uniref:RBR-type E3 ubiquitin transferase n=1 Tax=Amborella trichopoda TaxID=13333 RepID=U5D098_AMBTC|nr:probable E3 ubiquitin-protein ligase rbrA isoform X1 [Amborella trichopoda]ERN14817.1 hypothetical protein AMTR_s00032p00103340 [Amborella trichopoda]|eukprot:XP_006853350.1 probable E3 ubiquitin-protein ligase rbrA isoform X1 [Amborella trichopoda]
MESFGERNNGFSLKFYSEGRERIDEEDEYRSCVAEEEEWRDAEDFKEDEASDHFSKLFFKGVSDLKEVGSSLSGIGVILKNSIDDSEMKIQKKLDFFVEESVAELLALMDGLSASLKIGIRRIQAFTDSAVLYDQISQSKELEDQLLMALRQRVMEHASKLEAFDLKLIPTNEFKQPSRLAREAIGLRQWPESEDCSICCEEKQADDMVIMNCSHKFCSDCMIKYINGKLQSPKVPIRCPHVACKHMLSTKECKSFLPISSYGSFLKALEETGAYESERVYCPFPNCSVLLDRRQSLSNRASSSSQSEDMGSCVECPVCQRFFCYDCEVPWHSLMSCEEYQNMPLDERDVGDFTLNRLAQHQKWRRCSQCRRMIELTQGCYHMTCWCGHEFCYACGAEYRHRQQTCQCAFWDEDNIIVPNQEETMDPWSLDAYFDHERSQCSLLQRFLTEGFSLDVHCQPPSPPSDSFLDTIKDLHQLPWLERFVSVISDSYDDYAS